MTINQRIQIVMDLLEKDIINIDQAMELIDNSYEDKLASFPMETVEMDLP